MKRLDRYLAGAFTRSFALTLSAFVGLFVSITLFEELSSFLRYDASLADASLFIAGRLPWMISQSIPMASLLATLSTLAIMTRHGETTALRASGVSLVRIARPFLFCGLVLCLCTFALQETLVPSGSALAQEVENVRIKGRKKHEMLRERNVWMKAPGAMVNAERVLPEEGRMTGVTVMELNEGRVVRTIKAARARWTGQQWMLEEVNERVFHEMGSWSCVDCPDQAYPIAPPPTELSVIKQEPEQMSMAQLGRRISNFRLQSIDTTSLSVELWKKSSIPFAAIILPILAIPFALRSSQRSGLWGGIAVGLGVAFAYLITLTAGASLGKAGLLPPLVAAWTGNIIFAGVAVHLFRRAERG